MINWVILEISTLSVNCHLRESDTEKDTFGLIAFEWAKRLPHQKFLVFVSLWESTRFKPLGVYKVAGGIILFYKNFLPGPSFSK